MTQSSLSKAIYSGIKAQLKVLGTIAQLHLKSRGALFLTRKRTLVIAMAMHLIAFDVVDMLHRSFMLKLIGRFVHSPRSALSPLFNCENCR